MTLRIPGTTQNTNYSSNSPQTEAPAASQGQNQDPFITQSTPSSFLRGSPSLGSGNSPVKPSELGDPEQPTPQSNGPDHRTTGRRIGDAIEGVGIDIALTAESVLDAKPSTTIGSGQVLQPTGFVDPFSNWKPGYDKK